MIRLENITKSFPTEHGRKVVLDNVSVTFPTGVSVGLMGRNGAGKSTLMDIISGAIDPDAGRIVTDGTISWPIGFAGSFHRELTGVQNTRFIGRVYGVDTDELVAFVEDFAELGDHFYMPLRTYSAGMRSRLSFGVSMGIPFDTYLVDEVTSVGDAIFKVKSSAVFLERMKTSGALFVSHSIPKVRQLCTAGAVIEGGQIHYYDDVNDAIAHHQANQGTTDEGE